MEGAHWSSGVWVQACRSGGDCLGVDVVQFCPDLTGAKEQRWAVLIVRVGRRNAK